MIENLSFGLDIATALSVIAAAGAFIWNSILSRRKERNERRKEILKSYVFNATDKIVERSTPLIEETLKIRQKLRDGETTQNLEPWKEMIIKLPTPFNWLEPLDEVYGDGRFSKLAKAYEVELNEFILYFARLVQPGNKEEWDFDEVMNRPNEITKKYIARIYQETEDYFSTL
jgi:hypothetical protein